jgi:hypothetical protein
VKRFLHELFGLHEVDYYTGDVNWRRGVCSCGWVGDVDMTGKFF